MRKKRPISLMLVVLYKTVLGLVELVFGTTFAFVALGVKEVAVSGIIHDIITRELAEDPNDIFIHWLLTHDFPFNFKTALQISIVVMIIGVIKLIIAYAVWQHSHRAQMVTLVLVGALGLFGVIDTIHSFSWFRLVATSADFLLFYYLAWVLPKHVPLDEFDGKR